MLKLQKEKNVYIKKMITIGKLDTLEDIKKKSFIFFIIKTISKKKIFNNKSLFVISLNVFKYQNNRVFSKINIINKVVLLNKKNINNFAVFSNKIKNIRNLKIFNILSNFNIFFVKRSFLFVKVFFLLQISKKKDSLKKKKMKILDISVKIRGKYKKQ